MSNAVTLNQKIQSQIEQLDTAINQIQTGTVPDLARLENDVAVLCNELLSAPGDESRQTAEKMREMIGLLEHLAHELKDFQTVLRTDK